MRWTIALLVLLSLASAVRAESAQPLRADAAGALAVKQWQGARADRAPTTEDFRGRLLVAVVVGEGERDRDALLAMRPTWQRYVKAKDVAFVAVHTGDTTDAVGATFRDTGLAWPVGLDDGFAKAHGVETTPAVVLVDAGSTVRFAGPAPEPGRLARWIESWRPAGRTGGRIVGQPFGDLSALRWLNASGTPVDFGTRRLTLVRWWTDDCPHCTASLPPLGRLGARYASHGLRVLGIYHPKRRVPTSPEGVRRYARRIGFAGELAYDRRWTKLRDLMGRAGFRQATSVSFLVDANGEIVWAHAGPRIHPSRQTRHRGADADYRGLEALLRLWLEPKSDDETKRDAFVPVPRPGQARITVRTIGGTSGGRGDVKYGGRVILVDGAAPRTRRGGRSATIPAGRHRIRIAWTNHQVSEYAGIDETGNGPYSFLQKGTTDLVIDARAGRYYEVVWPSAEEPGGPTGFKDVTRPR